MSFMTFVLISDDNVLTPDVAFVSLSLFNIIRMPLAILPQMIIQCIQVKFQSATYSIFDDD